MHARALWIAIALVACKGDKSPPASQPAAPAGSASPATTATSGLDWARCEAALRTAPTLPTSKRAMAIIDACPVCGDWTPILRWQTPQQEGGPSHRELEDALAACKAWCEPGAKQRFLALLDDARATKSRGPWRQLGEVCGESVSASPDGRFLNAPYFALDRIAREVAARPGGAELLAPIEIPLPAVTVSGNGPALPTAPLSRPELLAGQLTITQADVSVGPVPVARLGERGITVAGEPYPGKTVTLPELATVIAQLVASAPSPQTSAAPSTEPRIEPRIEPSTEPSTGSGAPPSTEPSADPSQGAPVGAGPSTNAPSGSRARHVGVFAPEGLPAARIAEVISHAGAQPLVLAVRARSGPPTWSMYGVVPVVLTAEATPQSLTFPVEPSTDRALQAIKAADVAALLAAPVRLELAPDATVGHLATVLGALAFREVSAASIVVARPPRKPR